MRIRSYSIIGWGGRIHRVLLYSGVKKPNECSGYDTIQSDDEVPVILELWKIWSASSLPSLPGSLWPRVLASDRLLYMGQRELNCVLMLS